MNIPLPPTTYLQAKRDFEDLERVFGALHEFQENTVGLLEENPILDHYGTILNNLENVLFTIKQAPEPDLALQACRKEHQKLFEEAHVFASQIQLALKVTQNLHLYRPLFEEKGLMEGLRILMDNQDQARSMRA